ncbi:MAG: PAS domain S-box protein [Marinilabiliales bacterium]|nr:MAG: PAS domain S-box protein [Marinilabiliales bacterium]
MYFNLYSIPVFAAALIMLSLALLIRNHVNTPSERWFVRLMLAGTVYSLFYALELCSYEAEFARWFYRLEYAGIPFVPAMLILFSLSFTRKEEVRELYLLLPILGIPSVTFLLAFTHGYHDLFITGGEIDHSALFPVFVFQPGIWYWVHQGYALTAIITSILLMARMWFLSAPAFRKQVSIVLLGILLPFAVFIAYMLELTPRGLDPMPFSFAMTGMVIFAGIFRFRLFNLTPIARNILFDNIPDGVVVIDKDGRLVDYNRSAAALLQIEPEHVGKSRGTVFSGWPEIEARLSAGDLDFEVSRITRERALFLSCRLIPLKDDRGAGRGDMLILHDVSARKKAEIERQESEDKFGIIFENAPLGLMYYDIDGLLEVCNDYFVSLMGSSQERLTGLNIKKLPDKRIVAAVKKSLDGKRAVFQGRYTSVTGGRTVYVRAIFEPVFSDKGRVEGGMCIVEDITERKVAEGKIKKANRELKKINAEKDRFFSILAHDLRSPFSSFLGYTDILHDSIGTMSADMLQTIVSSMKESANNLYGLLENLLQWSRIQQGLTDYYPENLNVRERILDCVEPLLSFANSKAIDVSYDLPVDIAVTGDRKMFDTVARNLFTNAVKFTPRHGSVGISASNTGEGYVEICFSDTGIGMEKEMSANLFRLDVKTSRKGTEGEPSTGLGLILCHEFMSRQGGTIRVESREGEGSRFYMQFRKSTSGVGN